MIGRDDFENRLGQGLKRWAQAGEPSLDLEATVRERTGLPAAASPPRRQWVRWAAGLTAAVALVAGASLTFPTWAGAAAEWPLVGPVVTEIIMKDAGLKWAYEQGFIQGTVAEVTEDGITVRILGLVADSVRTTAIYQIIGWTPPAGDADARPRNPELRSIFAQPVDRPPSVRIAKVDDQGVASWSGQTVKTPVGLVGTINTLALESDVGTLTVEVRMGEKRLELSLPVKRTSEASREVVVNQRLPVGNAAIAVESVIYTPAETLVRYREEKQHSYTGAFSRQPIGGLPFLEVNGKRISTDQSVGINGSSYAVYPVAPGEQAKVRFVVPGLADAIASQTLFPLEKGATREVAGVPVTLRSFSASAGFQVEFAWEDETSLLGLGAIMAADAAGVEVSVEVNGESTSRNEGQVSLGKTGKLPDGFVPVAVRITQAAVGVKGPWIFDLPR